VAIEQAVDRYSRAQWQGEEQNQATDVGGEQEGRSVPGVGALELVQQAAEEEEMAHEGVPLNVIQRQPGHTHLGVTSIYLQGIDSAEIINAVHARRPPMMPASAGLRL
jgi:hypothetical protein